MGFLVSFAPYINNQEWWKSCCLNHWKHQPSVNSGQHLYFILGQHWSTSKGIRSSLFLILKTGLTKLALPIRNKKLGNNGILTVVFGWSCASQEYRHIFCLFYYHFACDFDFTAWVVSWRIILSNAYGCFITFFRYSTNKTIFIFKSEKHFSWLPGEISLLYL